ncbi:zinc ribbon domain-containing protein [Streptomyces sp. 11x1]|uniref:zinc ribbon domain-containing protein n=1 Tax=Streptomyces sp. 11x1 TaxID=3038642 RepID=UPI00292FCCBF|nr:zinc ribbon domain-containing protein [Streptomyces sp. 11x1]WNZ14500.1 zinc ribbon domain-containing protein [Streptomyces sp. 11x1]
MTRSAKGTVERPGRQVAQKSGLNRAILAQGWGLLRQRTGHKAPGRVEDVPAPYTSLRCSACGWIDKNSRKSQAGFVCSSCGFTCNADTNASINIAAGQGGIPRPRRTAGAGGTTPPNQRSSVREPQPERAGIPTLLRGGGCQTVVLDTRERVRDLGVLKALGMTHRQTVTMVVISVAVGGADGYGQGVANGVSDETPEVDKSDLPRGVKRCERGVPNAVRAHTLAGSLLALACRRPVRPHRTVVSGTAERPRGPCRRGLASRFRGPRPGARGGVRALGPGSRGRPAHPPGAGAPTPLTRSPTSLAAHGR